MPTLLVISKQLPLANALAEVLDPTQFPIVLLPSIAHAETLLSRGGIDATILDIDQPNAQSLLLIKELQSLAPASPIFIYTHSPQPLWENDAYLLGVDRILHQPVSGPIINTLLQRLFTQKHLPAPISMSTPTPIPTPILTSIPYHPEVRGLEGLRRFSTLLTHGLDSSVLLQQFLLLLREVIGVNRAAILLRKPSPHSPTATLPNQRKLHTAAAMGYDDSLLQHLPLSLNHGIGAHLHRHGRILQASTPEALQSREITKEFQLLGAAIAIPILDRQSLLGLLIFDERLTGNPFSHQDLTLIFHMLEEVGLAIRNAQIHHLLQKSHDIVADILNHLGSGCIVFDSHLSTLHANSTAHQIFRKDSTDPSPLEFSDLPQSIGSAIFSVIQSGVGIPAFKYQRSAPDAPSYRITIHPFLPSSPSLIPTANSALLVVEDITEHERALRLEIESANLRLIKSMAEHLAHEIGNALVPLSTHQQLLEHSFQDPEFQTSLSTALADGVKRISRLTSQMLFLAREWQTHFTEPVLVSDLLVEAFHQAHTFYSGKKLAQLSFNKDLAPWKIAGDHQALRHAFSEIMLNALQANPEDPAVAVRLTQSPQKDSLLQVEVRDSGLGFIHETAQRAPEPFFSTRVVGLGLGLTVSRKIIESHHGQIEIPSAEKGGCGLVRVSLPLFN